LTPEKKASLALVLSQMEKKKYDEHNSNNGNGHDFQQKYQSNLNANAAADTASASASAAKSSSSRHSNSKHRPRDNNENEDSIGSIYSSKQDPVLDKQLQNEMKKKELDPRYVHLQHHRRSLPSYDCSLDIINIINKNQVVVICGETGSGKTTQVAQYILDDLIQKGVGSTCKILCVSSCNVNFLL
jgi:HrpA-like RNA helicase